MKKIITEEMRKQIIIYASALIIGITAFLLVSKLNSLYEALLHLLQVCIPFIAGIFIAFVLHKPQLWLESIMRKKFRKLKRRRIRIISSLFVFVIALLFIVLFISITVPTLISSLQTFIPNISVYGMTAYDFIAKRAELFNLSSKDLQLIMDELNITARLTNYLTEMIPKIANYSYVFVAGAFKFVLAFISGLYILIDHEKLQKTVKKLTYSIFDYDVTNLLTRWIINAKNIFQKFIVGSIFDSLIIGCICYFGMLILRMPYAPLIGILIGITNIIPVFGPFLGAVPVIFLLLLIKPWYAVVFAIFILILQQVDGNILKPIILGDAVGLSSFWILFAVTVGGGLFGVLGMFLGVPVFALIYESVKDIVAINLSKKKIDINN